VRQTEALGDTGEVVVVKRSRRRGPDRERAVALEAVLSNAPELGIAGALEVFGKALTPTEARLVESLSDEEVSQLIALRTKLAPLGTGGSLMKDANNNNNNNDGDDEDWEEDLA
jgi:hypothetical protein